MNNLTTLANPFNFAEHDVRTALDENDNVWFCAKDVCAILDISWSNQTLENMPKEWTCMIKVIMESGSKMTTFINEPGLFRLIFRSNKSKAIEFSNWVFEEVLPSIRKTGSYGKVSPKDYIAIVKQIADLTKQLAGNKNAFTRRMLVEPLRNLCNMAGHPMPDIKLISVDEDQVDLFDGGES